MKRFQDGTLNDEHFIAQEKDNLVLYLPSHSNAVGNDGWNDSTIWFRSRIEDKDDRTVSQGFGKFFNLGQGPDGLRVTTEDVVAAIRGGRKVVATLKHDGSCLIRSVHNGKVIFRTRGSFSFEHHEKATEELAGFTAKYPKLLDVEWQKDKSLLFEWVTPLNQIVVKYEKAELHLIGGVHHGHRHITHLRYLLSTELATIAEESGIPLVHQFEITSVADWFNLYHAILKDREIEGYVLRLHDEQRLVKVKSELYLAKHSLKSQLSFRKLVELWLASADKSSELIVKQLEALYDEEVVMWALPYIIRLQEAIDVWEKTKREINLLVIARQGVSRKDFAIEMQQRFEQDRFMFGLAMLVWSEKPIPDNTIRTFMERFDLGDGNEA